MQENSSITELNPLTNKIVDCVFQVHKTLGAGLLESVYQEALTIELKNKNIPFKTECAFPLEYKGEILKSSFRLDMIIDDSIILELKAVEKILPVHEAQILSYLKLTNKKLGFLINFNVPLIKQGIKRYAL